MKNALLYLLIAAGFCMPMHAQAAPDAPKDKRPILSELMDMGKNAVQKKLDERRQKKAAKANEQATADDDEYAYNPPAAQSAVSPAPSTVSLVTQLVDEVLGGKITEVKEHYKEEGKMYARQLGDVIAQRILADKKVQAAVQMLKILAWVIVGYLTLVTVGLLKGLHSLKKSNERILALLREQRREQHK